jgi:DNA ligase (NAD+)
MNTKVILEKKQFDITIDRLCFELIEKHGGKNVGSISSKTNYVIAGENMGPEKLKKAKSLGIPIITEDDFIKMIE